MALVALVIGGFVAAVGILGIAAPEVFLKTIRFFQTPPAIYLAAAIRVGVGVVLIRAAPASRTPRILRVLGFIIVVGGLLTPFVGVRGAHVILDRWSAGGPALVRVWAAVAIAAGAFIVYSTAPNRRAA